uniref:Uncharacterized protein n=1 Tax=Glossina austeni TaxID=7395 RepID=A0A1A9UYX0_GLOAU
MLKAHGKMARLGFVGCWFKLELTASTTSHVANENLVPTIPQQQQQQQQQPIVQQQQQQQSSSVTTKRIEIAIGTRKQYPLKQCYFRPGIIGSGLFQYHSKPSGVLGHYFGLRLAHCRTNDLLHNPFHVLCENYNTLDSIFNSCQILV